MILRVDLFQAAMNESPDGTVLLSSRATFFFKFVFPLIWGGVWSWGTSELFMGRLASRSGDAPDPWLKWVFLTALVGGGLLCWRACYPLKRVVLDGITLRISNYRQEISVDVHQVSGAGFDEHFEVEGRSLVGLRFAHETEFGRTIEFVPRSKEALEILRARLGPVVGGPPERSELADELRGRGTA